MPGQIGNSGGKAGASGRKSAAQEHADYERLERTFTRKYDIEKIERRLKGKRKMSIEQRLIYNALTGHEQSAIAIFNKIYPQRVSADNLNRNAPTNAGDIPPEDRPNILRGLLELLNTGTEKEVRNRPLLPEQVRTGLRPDGGDSTQGRMQSHTEQGDTREADPVA